MTTPRRKGQQQQQQQQPWRGTPSSHRSSSNSKAPQCGSSYVSILSYPPKTQSTTNIHPSPPQFLLGLITIVPWAALILFDVALYLYRMILWELPWIGGRARGEQRPRAPSLNERPDGQRRAFGLRGVEGTDSGEGEDDGDGRSRGASVDKDPGTEKENVAPIADGWADSDAEGGVKRRAGRSEHS